MTDSDFAKGIIAAIGAHGAWKLRLKSAVASGRADITVEQARRDDCCDLGRMLHGQLSPAQKANPTVGRVVDLHKQFHQAAGDALAQALGGQAAQANRIIDGLFDQRSEALKSALMECKRSFGAH